MFLFLLQFCYMEKIMPLLFLWSEVERLMSVRGIADREELARITNIHFTNLSRLANGVNNPSFKAISKLCVALDCQPGDLLRFVKDDSDS